jgi:S1-C subfamily serine protease
MEQFGERMTMKNTFILLAALVVFVVPTYAQSHTSTWSSKDFESSIARPGFWNDGSGIFVEEMASPDAGLLAGVFHEGTNFVVLLGVGLDYNQQGSFTISPQAVTLESDSSSHLVLYPLPYPDPQIRKDSLEVKMQFKKEIAVKKPGDHAVGYLFFPYDDKASQVTIVVEVKGTAFRFPFSRDPSYRAKFVAPDTIPTATSEVQHPARSDRPATKTPAQVLDDYRGSIAVIVAAGGISQKLGTGFYVKSTGLLLTNFHVVEGAEIVGVKTKESVNVQWAKKARGFDLDNDLVALEVETPMAKPVALGDSNQVNVGEPVVVIGNPEGLEQTISNGLISGIREVDGRKLFQISAPISEGSSGSPVFNESGEVIGVVVSSLESGQNLNFAVPINYVKLLLTSTTEELISSLPKRTHSDAEAGNGASTRENK